MPASPLTALDYNAEDYWQDFLAKRPIAGGIAYEAELRNYQLDESLVSLQQVDTLLSQIRRDIAKAGRLDETTILADERYRNLLMFLAFYAGRVLARQWQNTPHWYGQFELRARYPELLMIADDFYQHMAVLYNDTSVFIAASTHGANNNGNGNDNYKIIAPVFFALEPIGLRLFGNIDRKFEAVHGGQISSGLYQAVIARLPNVIADPATTDPVNADHAPTVPIANSILNTSSDVISNTSLNSTESVTLTKTTEDNFSPETASKDASNITSKTTLKVTSATTLDAAIDTGSSVDETQTKPILTKNLSSSPSLLPETKVLPIAPPTPDIFTQLLAELDEIEVQQTVGNNDYQQALKILDQFERHIAKKNKPRAQVVFSKSHQDAKQQALKMLKNSADLGNTAAMLRLAMYELLGEGLITDNARDKDAGKEAGVEWVKQAAHKKDSRAQRLLSRMYYQGIGLPQDINNGKHWLEQAAENGHLEAASLVRQWQQAQALITTRQQEQHSLKLYQILIGAVIVAALLLIIFV